eukprot:TRINITY_DN10658_c0_g1_i1.p1 TRINITY_DN10658_c0_g1~~TRINITY_DN10658_c0_g1_i1.p1  ORF type:complete len:235 (+),score=22.22 TRINITY_DN10658_c0_g1_i1:56-760(+)
MGREDSLAGTWLITSSFGCWAAPNQSEFGIWRSEEKPVFKFSNRLGGKLCPAQVHFEKNGSKWLHVSDNLQCIRRGAKDTVLGEYILDGVERFSVETFNPRGLTRYRAESCSPSRIVWKMELPQNLGQLTGSLTLQGDGTSRMQFESSAGLECLNILCVRADRVPRCLANFPGLDVHRSWAYISPNQSGQSSRVDQDSLGLVQGEGLHDVPEDEALHVSDDPQSTIEDNFEIQQ